MVWQFVCFWLQGLFIRFFLSTAKMFSWTIWIWIIMDNGATNTNDKNSSIWAQKETVILSRWLYNCSTVDVTNNGFFDAVKIFTRLKHNLMRYISFQQSPLLTFYMRIGQSSHYLGFLFFTTYFKSVTRYDLFTDCWKRSWDIFVSIGCTFLLLIWLLKRFKSVSCTYNKHLVLKSLKVKNLNVTADKKRLGKSGHSAVTINIIVPKRDEVWDKIEVVIQFFWPLPQLKMVRTFLACYQTI